VKTLSEKWDIIRNNKELVIDLITNCSHSNFINMTKRLYDNEIDYIHNRLLKNDLF